MDDDELIDRWRKGDESAFEELRKRYQPPFLRGQFGCPVNHELRSRHQDEFQSLFDEVLLETTRKTTKGKGYDPAHGTCYKAYLRRSLSNRVCSWIKRKRRHGKVPLETDLTPECEETGIFNGTPARQGGPLQPEQDPADLATNLERIKGVTSAVAKLPEVYRDILYRRFALEQEYPQMAQDLGITESACRSRLERALDRLQDLLGGSHCNEE